MKLENLSWVDAFGFARQNGCAIRRKSWRVSFIVYIPEQVYKHNTGEGVLQQYLDVRGNWITIQAHFCKITEKDEMLLGWLPTANDQSSADWEVINPITGIIISDD